MHFKFINSPSTNMHKVEQNYSRVTMYTNSEGDKVDLGDDDDGDEDTPPYA
jgi:hypothetical protein